MATDGAHVHGNRPRACAWQQTARVCMATDDASWHGNRWRVCAWHRTTRVGMAPDSKRVHGTGRRTCAWHRTAHECVAPDSARTGQRTGQRTFPPLGRPLLPCLLPRPPLAFPVRHSSQPSYCHFPAAMSLLPSPPIAPSWLPLPPLTPTPPGSRLPAAPRGRCAVCLRFATAAVTRPPSRPGPVARPHMRRPTENRLPFPAGRTAARCTCARKGRQRRGQGRRGGGGCVVNHSVNVVWHSGTVAGHKTRELRRCGCES
eukprot:350622-Chlamydomonas_euryale.AAC.2